MTLEQAAALLIEAAVGEPIVDHRHTSDKPNKLRTTVRCGRYAATGDTLADALTIVAADVARDLPAQRGTPR